VVPLESWWDVTAVNAQRLALLLGTPAMTPHALGVLALDDTGDRKAGTQTAHVARQWLGSLGKIDNRIVAVTTRRGRVRRGAHRSPLQIIARTSWITSRNWARHLDTG